MISVALSGIGLASTAAVAFVSSIHRQKSADAASRSVKDVESGVVKKNREIVGVVAPAIATVGDSIRSVSERVDRIREQEGQVVRSVHLPLIGKVSSLTSATGRLEGDVGGVRSQVSDLRSQLERHRMQVTEDEARRNERDRESLALISKDLQSRSLAAGSQYGRVLQDIRNLQNRLEQAEHGAETREKRIELKQAQAREREAVKKASADQAALAQATAEREASTKAVLDAIAAARDSPSSEREEAAKAAERARDAATQAEAALKSELERSRAEVKKAETVRLENAFRISELERQLRTASARADGETERAEAARREVSSLLKEVLDARAPSQEPTSSPIKMGLPVVISVAETLVATLDNGGSVFLSRNGDAGSWRLVPSGKFKQIALDGVRVYGINAEGQIYSTNNVEKQSPDWVPLKGSLKQVDISGGVVCGVSADDRLFYSNYMSDTWNLQTGRLTQVSISGYNVCGVNAADEVFCAQDIRNPAWEKVAGRMRQVSVYDGTMYGVNATGIVCMSPFMQGNWDTIATDAKHVSARGGRLAILSSSGAISVRPAPRPRDPAISSIARATEKAIKSAISSTPAPKQAPVAAPPAPKTAPSPPEPKLVQASAGAEWVAAVDAEGGIYVSRNGSRGSWRRVGGALKHISMDGISMDGNGACGVNAKDQIYCANDISSPSWAPSNGWLKQISISGDLMCGVNGANQIFCTNRRSANDWKLKPGFLRYLSVDGKSACGVNAADEVFCARDVRIPDWKNIDSKRMRQVSLHSGVMYAVDSAGDVFKSPFMEGSWEKISTNALHVSAGGGRLAIVKTDGSVSVGNV